MLKRFLKRKVPTKEKNHSSNRANEEILSAVEKGGRFPWSKPARTIKRKGFELTLYKDGSRLYLFSSGGHLIITPQGSQI